jgi:hypothetical protein
MRIHLPRIQLDRFTDLGVDDLERLAQVDRVKKHELTDTPTDADVVLFPQCHMIDWRLKAIRRHPVAQRHWQKVMVYDERDNPWRSFPGVYVSAPARTFDPRFQRAWAYARVRPLPLPDVDEPDLLFSFVGSPSAACRRPLFCLQHKNSLVEEVRDFVAWDSAHPNFEARRRRFGEVLARSRFVHCPRGRGTSSFRLYETLAAGRVPVIISDEWVAPVGPDWSRCSLRFREDEMDLLISTIERADERWAQMSDAARAAYDHFFSEPVAFHRIAEALDDLRQANVYRRGRWSIEFRGIGASVRERVRRGRKRNETST